MISNDQVTWIMLEQLTPLLVVSICYSAHKILHQCAKHHQFFIREQFVAKGKILNQTIFRTSRNMCIFSCHNTLVVSLLDTFLKTKTKHTNIFGLLFNPVCNVSQFGATKAILKKSVALSVYAHGSEVSHREDCNNRRLVRLGLKVKYVLDCLPVQKKKNQKTPLWENHLTRVFLFLLMTRIVFLQVFVNSLPIFDSTSPCFTQKGYK